LTPSLSATSTSATKTSNTGEENIELLSIPTFQG
jgi:hypothetical protein